MSDVPSAYNNIQEREDGKDSPTGVEKTAPKKNTAFYAEMVAVTVLSLVAASMWIEVTKGTICRVFDNNPFVLLIAAIGSTLLAIFGLKYLFCDLKIR
jgi:hypothetical protein